MKLTSDARAWLYRTMDPVLQGCHLGPTERAGIQQELTSHVYSAAEVRARAAGRTEVTRQDLETALREMGGADALAEAFMAPLSSAPVLGGFTRRAAAFMLDTTILYGGLLVLWASAWLLLRLATGDALEAWRPEVFALVDWDDLILGMRWSGPAGAVSAAFPLLVLMAVQLLYYAHFEGTGGATPGKRALNLRVLHVDGRSLTRREAALRNLTKLVPPTLFPAILVDALFIVGGGGRQRASDRVFGTIVADDTGSMHREGSDPDSTVDALEPVQRELRP